MNQKQKEYVKQYITIYFLTGRTNERHASSTSRTSNTVPLASSSSINRDSMQRDSWRHSHCGCILFADESRVIRSLYGILFIFTYHRRLGQLDLFVKRTVARRRISGGLVGVSFAFGVVREVTSFRLAGSGGYVAVSFFIVASLRCFLYCNFHIYPNKDINNILFGRNQSKRTRGGEKQRERETNLLEVGLSWSV